MGSYVPFQQGNEQQHLFLKRLNFTCISKPSFFFFFLYFFRECGVSKRHFKLPLKVEECLQLPVVQCAQPEVLCAMGCLFDKLCFSALLCTCASLGIIT